MDLAANNVFLSLGFGGNWDLSFLDCLEHILAERIVHWYVEFSDLKELSVFNRT